MSETLSFHPTTPRPAEGSWLPMEGEPLRMILLRHGEVHEEDRTSLYGQLDVRLSELGREQSRQTGEALRLAPLAAVYSSGLGRAHFLAEEVAAHHGQALRVDDRLRERHFGSWQGTPLEDLDVHFPQEMARYREDRFYTRPPGGGESFADVRDRVLPFAGELIRRHRAETIVLACHGGPVRVLLGAALGLPMTSLFTFGVDYCSLSLLEHYESGRVRVRLLNSTHHLTGEGNGLPFPLGR